MKAKSALNKFFSNSALSLSKGFTLIELLIVITIISALAVTVFVALNPAQRLSDARDARRTSDVDSILTAIHAYIVDNAGSYPTGLAASTLISQIGEGASGCSGTVGVCIIAVGQDACLDDLDTALAPYLKTIPVDPNGTATETQYAVAVDANGLVTVTACGTEGTTTIEASR